MIAAYFTRGGKNKLDLLDLVRIVDGQRTVLETYEVMGKREARKIALNAGAEPWNF